MNFWNATTIIGALSLLGALGAYLKNTDKPIFPVVLALVGVFLCGAQAVKATIGPNSTTVEFSRQVAATADASNNLLANQNAAMQKLGSRLDTLETAFKTLQTAVNTKLAQSSTPLVAVPQFQALDASRQDFRILLRTSQLAHQRVMVETNQLKSAAAALGQ